MERKRVSFNIETATCGLCRLNKHGSDADDTTHAAVVFCKTCQEFLCATCLKRHRRLVASESHQILNRDHVIVSDRNRHENNGTRKITGGIIHGILSSEAIQGYGRYRAELIKAITKDESRADGSLELNAPDEKETADKKPKEEEEVAPKYNFTEYCPVHSDQLIKFYCEQHSQLCCEQCKLNDHRICLSNVKFIPEEVNHFETLGTPFRKLDAQIADFREYDRKLQHDLKELKKSRESFLHDLNVKKREILNWLNLMEVRAVRRLEIVFDKCKKNIDKKRQKAKLACEELRSEVYFLQEVLRNDTYDNIYKYIKMKMADQTVNESLKMKEHRQFTNTRFSLRINDDFNTAQRDAEQLYELTFEKKGETKFNIRLKNDRQTCNITGCAMLSAGGVVLADRNNANIKVFNSQFKLTATLNITDGLFDLTCISQNALAVTSPQKSKIIVAEIKPEPEIVKVIETGNGTCWGINHHEGIFIVNCSTKDTSFIRAIDIDANMLLQVETKCNFFSAICILEETGQLVISTATCHVDSGDAETLTYIDEHTVTNCACPQVKVQEYHYLNHLRTKGVTLDSHNNLVVCCKDTDQIYTLAHTGNEVELLLAEADGLSAPQALCYNDNKSKLLITSENTDFIQIFEFAS